MMNLQWVNEWRAPGLCLLARCRVVLRGWAGSIRNRFYTPSGIWLLVHGREAGLVDAPFAVEDAAVLDRIARHLAQTGLWLKFITASHLHGDHAAGLVQLAHRFSEATFVYPTYWPKHCCSWSFDNWIKCAPLGAGLWQREPRRAYDNGELVLDLEGEPVRLIHAPYHSPTDQLIVFRGVAITPDWHLPSHFGEQVHQVNAPKTERSISMRRILEMQQSYAIHSFIGVHADGSLTSDFIGKIRLALAQASTY